MFLLFVAVALFLSVLIHIIMITADWLATVDNFRVVQQKPISVILIFLFIITVDDTQCKEVLFTPHADQRDDNQDDNLYIIV